MSDTQTPPTSLLPCPFCGGTHLTQMEGNKHFCHVIMCPCGVDFSGGNNLTEAVAAWNRRASTPTEGARDA